MWGGQGHRQTTASRDPRVTTSAGETYSFMKRGTQRANKALHVDLSMYEGQTIALATLRSLVDVLNEWRPYLERTG